MDITIKRKQYRVAAYICAAVFIPLLLVSIYFGDVGRDGQILDAGLRGAIRSLPIGAAVAGVFSFIGGWLLDPVLFRFTAGGLTRLGKNAVSIPWADIVKVGVERRAFGLILDIAVRAPAPQPPFLNMMTAQIRRKQKDGLVHYLAPMKSIEQSEADLRAGLKTFATQLAHASPAR